MQVQPPQSSDLSIRQVPLHMHHIPLFLRLPFFLRDGRRFFLQYPPPDRLQRVFLSKVPFQFQATVPPFRTERDVFPKLDGIPFLFQIMEELFFRPCLCDRLIHVLPDDTAVGGPAFLLCPPFSILLRHSRMRMFDHGQSIL